MHYYACHDYHHKSASGETQSGHERKAVAKQVYPVNQCRVHVAYIRVLWVRQAFSFC